MPDPRRRLSAVHPSVVISLILAVLLLPGLVGPAAAANREPPGIDTFLQALGHVESGGRYTARNAHTGAYGKYQILPSSWRAWTRHYLHSAVAFPTPHNQEVIARFRVTDLYRDFGEWGSVAHWWLTGRRPDDPRSRTVGARAYVAKVMTAYTRFGGASAGAGDGAPGGTGTTAPAATPPPATVTFDDRSSLATYVGTWISARQSGYFGRTATSSTSRGASMSFILAGKSIEWWGPVGPTRGSARVSVDGTLIAAIDLYRPSYRPNMRLFRKAWPEPGRHMISIEVVGTPGHANVTIDAFVVGH